MKKNALLSMAAVVAAGLLAGCAADMPDIVPEDSPVRDAPIAFVPAGIRAASGTRGTQVTREGITSFGVSSSIYAASGTYAAAGCGSYFYDEEVDAASGRSGHYWPGTAYRVSFFAYAPYGNTALTVRSRDDLGYPVYSYTVPSSIAAQADFITADVLDQSGAGTEQPVSLSFSHRCSDIRFRVRNLGTDAITVHGIAVRGVKYTGTFSGNAWTLGTAVNSATLNPFLLTLDAVIDAGAEEDVTGTANHFIMLPQEIPAGTEIFVVDATVNGVRQQFTHTLAAREEWEQGKSYTYKLSITEKLLIIDPDTDIEDWTVDPDSDFVPSPSRPGRPAAVTDVQETGEWEKDPGSSTPTADPDRPDRAGTDGGVVGIEDWQEETG